MKASEIRKKSIVEYLATLGIKPASEIGRSFVFYSPWREEEEPSFHIFKNDGKFKDFGSGESGTIIDLVMRLESTDFKGALRILDEGRVISLPEFEKPTKPLKKGVEIISINDLKSEELISYLNGRCIPTKLGQRYLKQVSLRFPNSISPGKIHVVLGFKNDAGGFEFRDRWIKLSNSPKTITTLKGDKNVNYIFEGWCDFLSALVYFNIDAFDGNSIILNSLGFLGCIGPILADAEQNHLFVDHGAAADKALKGLTDNDIDFIDRREIFSGHGDFNEFLVARNCDNPK